MAISYSVFLAKDRMPSGAAWLDAAKQAGLALEFSPAIDPTTHNGYVPCPDERAGFELFCEPYRREHAEVSPAAAAAISDRDTSVTLRFTGRTQDREAAAMAAAALASMTDGILYDGEAGHFIDSNAALAWARNDSYRPFAVHRGRARSRRSRIRASTVVRLLMLALVTIVFWLLFG